MGRVPRGPTYGKLHYTGPERRGRGHIRGREDSEVGLLHWCPYKDAERLELKLVVLLGRLTSEAQLGERELKPWGEERKEWDS